MLTVEGDLRTPEGDPERPGEEAEALESAFPGRQTSFPAQSTAPAKVGRTRPESEAMRLLNDFAIRWRGLRILAVGSFTRQEGYLPAFRVPGPSHFLKDADLRELLAALLGSRGRTFPLSPQGAGRLLPQPSHLPAGSLIAERLTEREKEVLQALAQGKTNRDIAGELTISEATVRTHVSRILAKLGLSSRTQAAIYALQEGLA